MMRCSRTTPLINQERRDLRITDMRFCDIDGMPRRRTLLKLYTSAGFVGYGEVRDAATKTYAAFRATVPICTGEDIYLKEKFDKLLPAGGVSAIHPDLLTAFIQTDERGAPYRDLDWFYEYDLARNGDPGDTQSAL